MFYCHHLVLSDCDSMFLAVAAGVAEVGRQQEAAQSCQFVVEFLCLVLFHSATQRKMTARRPFTFKTHSEVQEFTILLINCEKTL